MCPNFPRDPLRDKQMDPPTGFCARCGAELYHYDGEICPECKEEIENGWKVKESGGAC